MAEQSTVDALCDQAWERALDRDPVTAMRCRGQVETLPPGGRAAMERDVSVAAGALARLGSAGGLQAAYLRDHLVQEVAEQQRFWYRFPVTPYNALPFGDYRSQILAARLDSAADADRYLKLLDDYVAMVEQCAETMTEQRRRGIRLPAWALPEATATVSGHASAGAGLMVARERLAGLAPAVAGRLGDGAARVVRGRLAGAWRRLLDDLAGDARGDEDGSGRGGGNGDDREGGIGIGRYPGGAVCYAGLIRLYTGLDIDADRVHAIGLAEVERITARIRDELGVADEAEYRWRLAAGPRAFAGSPEEVERLFEGHISRLLPLLPRYFARLPAAPFRLKPLDASLSGLTYGYYEAPGADGIGYYHYNVADLPSRPLLQAASVIYHEGLPGHHLQIGRQLENTALHPIRREPPGLRTFALNGYLEGWAEYAAGWCEEIGMYADPLDRYGRLSAERFQAARLVDDTGLNVLGWPRERAAAYLRANAVMSETEIGTELIRYAVDDPGQALGYHLGHWFLRERRGNRDWREFHEAVLAEGPLPLGVLGTYLDGQAASSAPPRVT